MKWEGNEMVVRFWVKLTVMSLADDVVHLEQDIRGDESDAF
jgi:hypothetical protein